MIKKIIIILGIFMTLTFISNVKFEVRYLVDEDDTIEWNAYEVGERV